MKPNDDNMVSDTYVSEDTLKALAASLLSSMLQAAKWNPVKFTLQQIECDQRGMDIPLTQESLKARRIALGAYSYP
jgi:hypothetical protein